jgi:CheY-like chemotaxis protein
MAPEKRDAQKSFSTVVGELTSGDLHSLNNFLQGIVGLSELLYSNPNLPYDAKMDAQVILGIAEDASEFIRKMRDAQKVTPSSPPADVSEPVAKAVPSATKSRRDMKILVAEDDPLVLNVVVGMLKALGYNPIPTKDGIEARDKWNEIKDDVSLVLADLVMPRMGGLELAEELLAADSSVKIVVMTGYLREEADIDPDEFGLSGWIEKPMTAARLEQVIVSVVGS